MNQELSKLKCVDKLFVCGSAGDESLSIGGNYYLNKEGNNKPLKDLYLGNNINLENKKFKKKNNRYKIKFLKDNNCYSIRKI